MLVPYIRRSREDEERISIDQQRQDILDWAARTGAELADEVVEAGVSGRTAWRERELGAVVERCRSGEAEGVVVAYASRLTREKLSATFDVLEELEPHRLVCVREGVDKPPGRRADLATVIHGYQASEEWHTLRGNLQKGKHDTWRRGGYVGHAPAGYEKDGGLLRKSEHADAVGRALQVRAGGGSWAEVARSLTASGVPTRHGGTVWSVQACRALARNPVYRGEHRCTCGCGETAFRAEWAVVPPSVWEQARPLPSGRSGRRDPGGALLAGLLFCAGCGSRLVIARRTRGDQAAYRCSGGLKCEAKATIAARKVEPYVKEEALDYLMEMGPTVGHAPDVEAVAALEHERGLAAQRLEALVRMLDPLEPGAEDRLAEARDAVRAAEEALLAEKHSEAVAVTAEQARVEFEQEPVDRQRMILRSLIHGATVRAGRQTEPVQARVDIEHKIVFGPWQ